MIIRKVKSHVRSLKATNDPYKHSIFGLEELLRFEPVKLENNRLKAKQSFILAFP